MRNPTLSYKRPRSWKYAALLPGMVLLISCAAAPVQEMSDARQSIDAAHAAGAEQHAPAPLRQARRMLLQATQQLETRQYKQAKQSALTARGHALEARREALAAERPR